MYGQTCGYGAGREPRRRPPISREFIAPLQESAAHATHGKSHAHDVLSKIFSGRDRRRPRLESAHRVARVLAMARHPEKPRPRDFAGHTAAAAVRALYRAARQV